MDTPSPRTWRYTMTILLLLVALMQTAIYAGIQHRYAAQQARDASRARAELTAIQERLQTEQDTTEGLKACMTFDRKYIQSLERDLAGSRKPGGEHGFDATR